jgi:molecular chaperone GrpE
MDEENKKQINSSSPEISNAKILEDKPESQAPAQNITSEEVEKLKKDCADYLAGWQRAKADFINHKKEEAQRFEEMIKFSNESLIRDLIGPIDSFDLGVAALEKKGEVEKGIYMIKTQLEDVLKKYGLEKISVKPGDKFNPSVAESLGEEESEQPPQTVAEEIESGYRLNGKLIRPARVKISKGK